MIDNLKGSSQNDFSIGKGSSDKNIVFNEGSVNKPGIKWDNSETKIRLSNDGINFEDILTQQTNNIQFDSTPTVLPHSEGNFYYDKANNTFAGCVGSGGVVRIGSGTNTGDETAARIGAIVNGSTPKTTPIDTDLMAVVESSVVKQTTWANIKATLKSYFDLMFKKYHGVYARSTAAGLNCLPVNLTTTTFTLGATANPLTYYYQGTRIVVSADITATLDDGLGGTSAGLYYVYFNAALGTLLATKSHPGITNVSNVTIATVAWNGTDYGLVCDERHGYDRDCSWHEWAHDTIGCRYQSGVELTHNSGKGAAATFSSTGGNIHDEDIDFSVLQSSSFPTANTCRLLWQTSASTYAFDKTVSAIPFKVGANDRPVYIKQDYSIVQMTDVNNRYINFFVYVTTDVHTPIYIVAERISDTLAADNGYKNVTAARAALFPNLNAIGIGQEIKAIYRLIVRADGTIQPINLTLDDYRTVTSLPQAAGNVSTTASTVQFTPTTTILSSNVQGAIEEVDSGAVDYNLLTGISGGRIKFYTCTQVEYDAIVTPDVSTIYLIKEA